MFWNIIFSVSVGKCFRPCLSFTLTVAIISYYLATFRSYEIVAFQKSFKVSEPILRRILI